MASDPLPPHRRLPSERPGDSGGSIKPPDKCPRPPNRSSRGGSRIFVHRTPKLSSDGSRVSYEPGKADLPPQSAAAPGSACLWPPSRSRIGIMGDHANPCRP